MKILLSIVTDSGKKIEQSFDDLSAATTYMANDLHKIVRNEAEATSQKMDRKQKKDRDDAEKALKEKEGKQ